MHITVKLFKIHKYKSKSAHHMSKIKYSLFYLIILNTHCKDEEEELDVLSLHSLPKPKSAQVDFCGLNY